MCALTTALRLERVNVRTNDVTKFSLQHCFLFLELLLGSSERELFLRIRNIYCIASIEDTVPAESRWLQGEATTQAGRNIHHLSLDPILNHEIIPDASGHTLECLSLMIFIFSAIKLSKQPINSPDLKLCFFCRAVHVGKVWNS